MEVNEQGNYFISGSLGDDQEDMHARIGCNMLTLCSASLGSSFYSLCIYIAVGRNDAPYCHVEQIKIRKADPEVVKISVEISERLHAAARVLAAYSEAFAPDLKWNKALLILFYSQDFTIEFRFDEDYDWLTHTTRKDMDTYKISNEQTKQMASWKGLDKRLKRPWRKTHGKNRD